MRAYALALEQGALLHQMRREVLLAKERGEAGIRNAGRERTISPALGVVRPGSDVFTV